jgi:predicted DCC family thiol-disulfide oxidoreductase YuxK
LATIGRSVQFHSVRIVTPGVPVADRLNHWRIDPVRPTFVYDGDCAFCSSCARFIERRIHGPALVGAWQRLDLAALGLTADQCSDAVQWVGSDGQAVAGPAAIARLLRHASGRSGHLLWHPVGAVLATRPVLALAWPAYRWVARNRHRLPGGTAACALPGRPGTSAGPAVPGGTSACATR